MILRLLGTLRCCSIRLCWAISSPMIWMGVDCPPPCIFLTLPSFLLKPRVVTQASVPRNPVGTWYMPQKARGLIYGYDGPVGCCFRNTSLRNEEITPVQVSFPDPYPDPLSSFMLCLNCGISHNLLLSVQI